MSRLEVMSAPLYVAKRTDPAMVSEKFLEEAVRLVGDYLSEHSLRTIGERLGLTDEAETLAWLDVTVSQHRGSLWRHRSADEIISAVKELAGYKVPAEYAKALASKYDLIADTRDIAQLFVYRLPAEWAVVASIAPWKVYSLQLMHEAGVPAEYTVGWDGVGQAERVSDFSLVSLYEAGVPLEYAQAYATTHKPMRAATLWSNNVPHTYLAQFRSYAKSLPPEVLIDLYRADIPPADARKLIEDGLAPEAVVLVVRDGVPVEYARAVA